MIEGGTSPRPDDVPQVPSAREVMDRIDRDVLPRAIELGTPKIGAPVLQEDAVHEKYADLGRGRLEETVGLEALRRVAVDGKDYGGLASNDNLRVRPTREGGRKVYHVAHTDTEHDYLTYEKTPVNEKVHVEHHVPGETRRFLEVTFRSSEHEVSVERNGQDEALMHVNMRVKQEPDGKIYGASISTTIFEGK